MNSEALNRQRTYTGWQQEKVAFLFGLSARRAAMLATAALAFLLPLAASDLRSALALWPAALVLAAGAMARVGGRTGDEWLAGLLSYAMVRAQGQHRYAGGPFAATRHATANMNTSTGGQAGGQGLELPGILAPLRLLSVPANGGRDLAIVENRCDRTYTAVARIRFPGVGLSDSVRRDQRVAGWGALLASLCTEGSPLVRVQAFQKLVPDSGADLRSWHDAHVSPAAPPLALAVARDLLAQATVAASRRESYLAITMDARRAAAQIRSAGGGDLGAAAVLVRHLRGLQPAIAAADLEVEDWLRTGDLAEVIRAAYDPGSEPALAARRAAARAVTAGTAPGTQPGVPPDLAGPAYAESNPACYLHDGAATVSYWVHSWPKGEAYCTALAPLLADGPHRRSFAMTFEPLGPRQAERAVMRERTARHVAVSMRQRTGQIVPEHERAAMGRALAQDAERAAGHGLTRLVAFATVTATADTIADACAALEADAAQARIELRRMWFAQDSGFALGALPLGMTLPKRGW